MFSKFKKKIAQHSLQYILKRIDEKYGFGYLELHLNSNWFNPIATIYLNLRSFPFKQAIKLPIYVYGRPKLYCLTGNMLIAGKISCGMIKFNQTKPGAPSNMGVQSEIVNKGTIIFHGKGLIGTGNKIFTQHNAIIELGSNFKITDMCNIGCFSKIDIGEQSRIVHRCQIFDSNYHYLANFNTYTVPPISNPIKIGKGCWICNTTTITGGCILPDFTIVASNSLASKDYSNLPNSSLIGGIPAKLITTGIRKIENSQIEHIISTFYKNNTTSIYTIPPTATKEEYSFVDIFK